MRESYWWSMTGYGPDGSRWLWGEEQNTPLSPVHGKGWQAVSVQKHLQDNRACQHLRDAPGPIQLNDGSYLPEGHMWEYRWYEQGGSPAGHDWICRCGVKAVRRGVFRKRWEVAPDRHATRVTPPGQDRP